MAALHRNMIVVQTNSSPANQEPSPGVRGGGGADCEPGATAIDAKRGALWCAGRARHLHGCAAPICTDCGA